MVCARLKSLHERMERYWAKEGRLAPGKLCCFGGVSEADILAVTLCMWIADWWTNS